VTPSTGINASGVQGQPISPSTFKYKLTTNNGSSVRYSISNLPNWLTASSTSGIATSFGTTITFSIKSTTRHFGGGTYNGSIKFGSTTGPTTNLPATLTVAAATAAQTQYTVAVSASPSAGGTVSGGGTFAAGSSQTVTATANIGYSFV